MDDAWTAVRVARPSENYDRVVEFYRDLVGLPVLGDFADHSGYDGSIFGLPDQRFQLELTRHSSGRPLPRPTDEDLLVLYFATAADRAPVMARMRDAGCAPVELANPFWANNASAFRDPDGWTLVLTLQG